MNNSTYKWRNGHTTVAHESASMNAGGARRGEGWPPPPPSPVLTGEGFVRSRRLCVLRDVHIIGRGVLSSPMQWGRPGRGLYLVHNSPALASLSPNSTTGARTPQKPHTCRTKTMAAFAPGPDRRSALAQAARRRHIHRRFLLRQSETGGRS